MNYKAIGIRALKTFIQGFLASLTYGLGLTDSSTTSSAYRALVVAAFAAGVSAVMNLYLKPTEAK